MKKMMATMMIISLLSVGCNKTDDASPADSDSTQTPATGDSGSTDSGPEDGIGTVDTSDPNSGTDAGTETNGSGSTSGGNTSTNPTPPPATSTLPAFALSFKSNVKLFDFSSTQTTKYNRAVSIVKKVVATEEFRTKILNHKYLGVKQFANNNGLTNAQIYQAILEAAETLKPAKNNTMDIGVKLYYENNTVVGWTNPSITYINVNTKFFNSYDYNEVAGNLFHEWMHKLGYGHDSSATSKRPYSVPYAVGYLIRDIGADFL